jgi:hypothetical protein
MLKMILSQAIKVQLLIILMPIVFSSFVTNHGYAEVTSVVSLGPANLSVNHTGDFSIKVIGGFI